jgi:hypothetical protein
VTWELQKIFGLVPWDEVAGCFLVEAMYPILIVGFDNVDDIH